MISYTKEIRFRKSGKKWLHLDIDDPQYEILGAFLSSEVPSFGDVILKTIDMVLCGEEEKHSFAGNSCELTVTKTTSHIECMIDGAEVGAPCDVDTEELKQTVLSWMEDLRAFRNTK